MEKSGVLSFVFSIIQIFLILLFVKIFNIDFEIKNLIFFSLSVLIFSYLILKWMVNNFIYSKVKLIYKNIRNSNSRSDLDKNINLQNVNREVENWKLFKNRELEKMTIRESYRRRFVGNVAHELKTPIFNIQGYINTLLDGAISDNKINRKFLSRANKSVSRMIYIVEDLDQITRLEEGKIEIENKSFDLLTEINDVIENLDIKAKKRGLKIKIINNYKSKIPVKGDKEKIKQVLYNLIENSIKYGNDMSTIDIKLYDMDVNILTEVSDSGNGIEQKHLNKIFDRFYRVDSSRDREKGGSGLGLSIVKHIIEAHGHSINVRSTIGEGSTFSFTLTKSK
ncbi:MAG: sensor histidine kinase [Flavobacteriales bacterium TMED288]|nr:two-component sensor histidine kinase [Flavobacteriales bacterium]RPG53833.1 MAG: sensor histidine kinase [Flavobacteriales bacterium TMED288]|tara:strand:- start:1250 stop:2263 length:1014 start_codon:yes stop_codon:yes gene_type:complete